MKLNTLGQRLIALLLAFIMLTGTLPVAFAEELAATPTDIEPVPLTLREAILADGCAYVQIKDTTPVYLDSSMAEEKLIFTLTDTACVLLATEYTEAKAVKVWCTVSDNAAMTGYVDAVHLGEYPLTPDELSAATTDLSHFEHPTEAGPRTFYQAKGDFAEVDEPPLPEESNETENVEHDDQPTLDENETVTEADETDPAAVATEPTAEPEIPVTTDDPEATAEPAITAKPEEISPLSSYVQVTQATRVFPDMDETADEDYPGDLCQGLFTKDAIVQVEGYTEDCIGRVWYLVRYRFGDTFANGTLKWTDTDTVVVLAEETAPTDSIDLTVTDYAWPCVPVTMSLAEEPVGFSLKDLNDSTGSFYAGQSGLNGSSGSDADYPQLARMAGKGKIYATPHYLEGYTVYCLEHTLPGPGENISDGGQQPTGPYTITDWESYLATPGYSGAIYGEDTMHAIGWVLYHTYPFKVLDRTDRHNKTWSRAAGQFAIREVIKTLEGAQYVRDFWRMDEFYTSDSTAPQVYLDYARWLARNAIAHARQTGEITVTQYSAGVSGSGYYGTATLSADADLMRISRSAGDVTGYTGGSDDAYYYVKNGDTITMQSNDPRFSFTVESVATDEANFFVGVPNAAIQKVLIPRAGAPYAQKEISLAFEVTYGTVIVTKTDAETGAALANAAFALLDGSGKTIQTAITDSTGKATFSNISDGTYQVQEIGAPEGYIISAPAAKPVTVVAGQSASVSFADKKITSKVQIIKTDAQTGAALPGAVFTVENASGGTVATLTTGADGTATSGWLPYGCYTIRETSAPAHYDDDDDLGEELTDSPDA